MYVKAYQPVPLMPPCGAHCCNQVHIQLFLRQSPDMHCRLYHKDVLPRRDRVQAKICCRYEAVPFLPKSAIKKKHPCKVG